MLKVLILSVAFGTAAAALAAQASQTPDAGLKVGDVAPDFELTGSDGKTWRLRDLRGKAVVLAWFPKAFTGG
jgi:thioredoxin-dependent peroxiredoxin